MRRYRVAVLSILLLSCIWALSRSAIAQSAPATGATAQNPLSLSGGDPVPREVRGIYQRGLEYLVKTQGPDGNWKDGYGGPGTTGMGLMVLLASGEDPNFGKYRQSVRNAIRALVEAQDPVTGYLGDSMYHHGFAMLALAECYGAVDETDLWDPQRLQSGKQRTIGQALELAVRCAVTAQSQNPYNAWRYSPNARDADTSVSGAVLMGLLAARNAGIEVPDKSIDLAIDYFASMTGDSGAVGYSGGLGGFGQSIARSSIACLVYSIAKRRDLPQYNAVREYILSNLYEQSHYEEYARYYEAQALFQADVEVWEKWNRRLVGKLKSLQNPDGSFTGQFGNAVSTSLNLLALAVNFKFLPIYER